MNRNHIFALALLLFLALSGCGRQASVEQEGQSNRAATSVGSRCGTDAVSVGGYCWYLAAAPRNPGGRGQSCQDVCSIRGGVDREGQDGYAGYLGSNYSCRTVADAFATAKRVPQTSGRSFYTDGGDSPCGVYMAGGNAKYLYRGSRRANLTSIRSGNYNVWQTALFCACNQ